MRVKREDDSTEKAVLREKRILVGDTGEGDADGCGHPCHGCKVEHCVSRFDFSIMDFGFRTYRCTKSCPKAE